MKGWKKVKEQLISLKERALSEIKQSSTMEEVDSLRVKYSGKKGELTAILKGMGKLSAEERQIGFEHMIEIALDI